MDKYDEDVPSWDDGQEYLNSWRCKVPIRLENGRPYHIDSIWKSEQEASERASQLKKAVVRPARTFVGQYVVFEEENEGGSK